MSSTEEDPQLNRGSTTSNASTESRTRRPPGQSILRSSKSRIPPSPRGSNYSQFSSSSIASGEGKSTSFFRSFFAQRTNDYPSDAPSELHHSPADAGGARGVRHASFVHNVSQPSYEDREEKRHWCRECFRPSQRTLDAMSSVMESRIYQALIVFETILLLFGAQIQTICIPRDGDTAMDVLFTIALAVFSADIVMRMYLEPLYFAFPIFCKKDRAQSAWGRCQLGSFLFWCDLASTLSLLFSISYINKSLLRTRTIRIGLDRFGVPVDGLTEINTAVPVEVELPLVVLIMRTARVARFIRESTRSKSGSIINWYYLFQRINPLWYLDRYRKQRSLRNVQGSSADSVSESNHSARDRLPPLVKSSSWSGLQLAIMAKRRTLMTQPEKPRGIKGMRDRALGLMGIKRQDNEELRRQIAACKIQRAWRATVSQHAKDFSEHVAWSSQRGGPTPGVNKMKLRHMKNLNRRPSVARNLQIPKNVKNAIREGSTRSRRPESQVGSAMRELTGQRVAIGIILALVLTVFFTYGENDATRPSAMIVLHNQTANAQYANASLNAARESSIPDLYFYRFADGKNATFELTSENPHTLRPREILQIFINDTTTNNETVGYFAYRNEEVSDAWVEILSTLFILLVWFFGVTAFAGPVMTLVVIPIERMVTLLKMLMVDPLGYQSTSRYKKFVAEEDELTKNTRWTKEVLKGMETSFLMSTILRIGSLMKVGFGSAGVEIIRNNLEKGQSKNMLILNSQGSTVSCIFLFCDIRQFTDATECLQEEVFVFTNRIAGVVHSICHSYGGSANKNIGDAFLLSWLLDEASPSKNDPNGRELHDYEPNDSADDFTAKNNQADKALLSVVKISIALHHDKYYLEPVSEAAREALLAKLSKRPGPVVQMGCGLHAGKAVQGAIGSQRKIDATYVSESVERAEFLESATKKYGLKMLMSDSFHRLLHSSNRRRCRKIDQIRLQNEEDEDEEALDESMELFTFDMDIDALWRPVPKTATKAAAVADDNVSDTESLNEKGSKRELMRSPSVRGGGLLKVPRRRSISRIKSGGKKDDDSSDEMKAGGMSPTEAAAAVAAAANSGSLELTEEAPFKPPELVLPTGPALYNANVWLSDDMRRIRQLYSDGLFFQKFNSGFLSYYARDWEHAKQCFQTILERFDDGPSRYFLKCIEDNDGVPPRNFHGYGYVK